MLKLSQSWLVGAFSFWLLCPFDMTPLNFKGFFASWDNKKSFLPMGQPGSLLTLEQVSFFFFYGDWFMD